MSAGAVMERMRRRLCINLGKNAELKKEEDRKQTPTIAVLCLHTNKIWTSTSFLNAQMCCTCKGAENGHACISPQELTWN